MKNLILLILLISSYQSFSQIKLNSDNTVTIPVDIYRIIRDKFYVCDTAIANRDEKISIQDSVIVQQNQKIESFKLTIIKKDSTIVLLKEELFKPDSKDKKPVINIPTLTAGLIGLILGILLVR